MKKLFAIISLGIIVLCCWLISSKVKQAHRETTYKAAMALLQRDLPVGMSRADVKNYLDSHNIQYNRVSVGGEETARFEIQIGEEPGSIFCDDWRVVVAMDFSKDEKLKDMRITKWGTCL